MNTEQKSIPKSQGSSTERPCLLVILRPQLILARDLRWPLKGFVLGDKQYRDAAFGNWTAFYDWLRDAKSNLLGVRYWLGEDTMFLVEHTRTFSYVNADPARYIEIYFSEYREIEPRLSGDQDFLYAPVFRSDDGEYALGFGMEGLSQPNLRSLARAPSEWAVARPL